MLTRTRIIIAVLALTLLVAPTRYYSDSATLALWSINAHAASVAKAQWQQAYWAKRHAQATESMLERHR